MPDYIVWLLAGVAVCVIISVWIYFDRNPPDAWG
jgi:hypothetical protein